MRAERPLLTLLTFLAVLALGYVAYSISAGVHPGPAPPTLTISPLERDH